MYICLVFKTDFSERTVIWSCPLSVRGRGSSSQRCGAAWCAACQHRHWSFLLRSETLRVLTNFIICISLHCFLDWQNTLFLLRHWLLLLQRYKHGQPSWMPSQELTKTSWDMKSCAEKSRLPIYRTPWKSTDTVGLVWLGTAWYGLVWLGGRSFVGSLLWGKAVDHNMCCALGCWTRHQLKLPSAPVSCMLCRLCAKSHSAFKRIRRHGSPWDWWNVGVEVREASAADCHRFSREGCHPTQSLSGGGGTAMTCHDVSP